MITDRVVEELGLEVEGYSKIHHVRGEAENIPVYYVNLMLLNNVRIVGVQVMLAKLIDTDVLIGMNIINKGDFALSNKDGVTTFSFRVPSVENFDFVSVDDKYNRKKPKPRKRRASKGRRGKR